MHFKLCDLIGGGGGGGGGALIRPLNVMTSNYVFLIKDFSHNMLSLRTKAS